MKPKDLILRCYGQKRGGTWYGVCLELNIAAEADSLNELKNKINSMILSYIEAACDTEDKPSIPFLLRRRAPITDWCRYYFIALSRRITNLPDKMTFDQVMPFKLVHSC